MQCECGVVVKGGSWHLSKHRETQSHKTRMADTEPVVTRYQTVPVPEDAEQEQPRRTLHRMADVLRGKHPEPSVSSAFDGATLVGETPPVWPRNPVSVDEPTRRPTSRTRGRPPGAEDLTPLFATGLVLLTTFAVGEWSAPTGDEANAIATPLANIMARRIDLAAKLGRDASDTIALVVALMAYSYRVVPLAADRVRGSLDERRSNRVSRDGLDGATDQPSDGSGQAGVASGEGNGVGPDNGSAYHPFDALAKARNIGLNVFDRSLDSASGRNPTVADR